MDASGNAITVDQGLVKIPAGFQLQLFGRGPGKSFKIPASLEWLEILLFLSVGLSLRSERQCLIVYSD